MSIGPTRPYRGPWQIATIVWGAIFGFFVLFIWVSATLQVLRCMPTVSVGCTLADIGGVVT